MFAVSFAIILLITIGINGQSNDINTLNSNNVEKGYPFGKLRLSEDGKTEELISINESEKPQLSQDQSSSSSAAAGVQPLPSPCVGTSASTKLAHPKDKTKYIQCRDEFHYEIYTCPNGGDYNEQTNSCDLTVPIVDKCEEEKPCLNDGQCSVLSDSTFKCTCKPDWTGERCETPVNSCVKKPCGPGAECRTLKTGDYDQDYVCVCHGTKGYGLNCQEAVPNPCLTTTEQFFPYAFSQHAYIQCDGELIYFQPCGPVLYWNQEEKICDRKRPAKIDLPALLTKYAAMNKEDAQEKETIKDISLTPTESAEQQNQLGKGEEAMTAFIPARVANRQQLLANFNNQQGINREFEPKTQSFVRQPSIIQAEQTQPWSQNTQQQYTPTLTATPSSRRSFVPKVQVFSNQQPLMQEQVLDQDKDTKGKQFFGGASQSWQGAQQGAFPTATPSSSGAFQQGFQNQNTQAQIPSWQHPPTPQFGGMQSPQTSGFNTATPSWQNPQPVTSAQFPNPHQQPFLEAGVGSQSQGFQQGFQTPSSQFSGAQTQPSAGFPQQGTQSFGQQQQQQQQPWQGSQSFHNQQQSQTTGAHNAGFQQGLQTPGSQFGGAQLPQSGGFQGQNSQTFLPQQSWQTSQPATGQQFQSPSSQFGGVQSQPSVGFPQQGTQNFGQQQQQPWQGSQAFQTQQQFPSFQAPGAQFGGAQSPQTPGFPPQNSQSFGQQPWLKSQNNQNKTFFPKQILPPLTTTTMTPSVVNFQPLQNSTVLSQDQLPSTIGFNPQPFVPKQPSWQSSQLFQNQQQLTPLSPEGLSVDNKNRFQQSNFQQPITPSQQSWQTKTNSQITQNPIQPETSLIDIQRPPINTEQQLAGQPIVNQQWSSTGFKNSQIQKPILPPIKQQQQQDFVPQSQVLSSQQRFSQIPSTNSFGSQSQSWQGSQTFQNDQPLFETTTIAPTVNRYQSVPSSNTDFSHVFAFQPKQWQDTSKQTQQSFNINPSSSIQNTQFGLNNQQQTVNDQRKTLDPLPTAVSGSWKARSSSFT